MICAYCGENNEEGAVFCGRCGRKLSVETETKQETSGNICLSCGQPLEAGALFCGYCGARVADSDDEQDSDDEWIDAGTVHTAMIRKSTGETIDIDRYPIVIGRSQTCDYIVMNNLAIGRQHAKIEQKDGHIYITDLGSSNHTFVEGKRISEPTEVYNGTIVKLADELFDIVIK